MGRRGGNYTIDEKGKKVRIGGTKPAAPADGSRSKLEQHQAAAKKAATSDQKKPGKAGSGKEA